MPRRYNTTSIEKTRRAISGFFLHGSREADSSDSLVIRLRLLVIRLRFLVIRLICLAQHVVAHPMAIARALPDTIETPKA
eukprot:5318452-Heterocapsa_arctica.AAC.1